MRSYSECCVKRRWQPASLTCTGGAWWWIAAPTCRGWSRATAGRWRWKGTRAWWRQLSSTWGAAPPPTWLWGSLWMSANCSNHGAPHHVCAFLSSAHYAIARADALEAGTEGVQGEAALVARLRALDEQLRAVHEGLAPNCLLMVVSGTGDSAEVRRLQKLSRAQDVAWTLEDQQRLQQVSDLAARGIVCCMVKS